MREYIKGSYRKSFFQNGTGYHIGLFRVSETNILELNNYVGKTITFTGYFHELTEDDTYIFYGKKVIHEKYGEQFQVESYERCHPEEKDSIMEFLTSGLFKGIGQKKAQAIVDVLGKDTLKIILENPDNLILIPGITKKNIEELHNKLKDYEASYETIIYLGDLGFITKDAIYIYNFYKSKTKEIIATDIYKLLELNELTFKKIDYIALNMGIAKNAHIRIKASLIYIMNEISNTYGHSYYYEEELLQLLPRVLKVEVSQEEFTEALNDLLKDMQIIKNSEKYYLKEMYESERLITRRFKLLSHEEDYKEKKLLETIKEIESFYEIKYNEDQLEAIKKSYLKHFLIITGGPGTGKTTIMKAIVELFRIMYKLSYEDLLKKVALLAPTGRAAKRMSETTNLKASTIHRFLKWQKDTNKFQVNEYNKSKVEFVIIDEASMIDTYLMANLLKGLSVNCKIIMVGDDHQLPSVGPGQVLHDLISSNMLEVVELKKLYRQGEDSNIITLAYQIRNGFIDRSIFNIQEDLTFINCKTHDVISNITEIASTYKDLSYKNFQILCPMYKGLNGIDAINNEVQKLYNKKNNPKKEIALLEYTFKEDDKVIQLTNMPDDNVYNGDIGLIENITTHPKKEVEINFDGTYVKYMPSNFNNFRLAYAISIHKSQGSEFDVVILPLVKSYGKMLYRKLVYTAITRAKKKLYLIGDLDALDIAIQNNNSDIRRTTIKDMLNEGIKVAN